MDLHLDGKVAIVTGGGQGIGRAISMALAGEGARVLVNDLNAETAAVTVEEIRSLGVDADFLVADVTNFDAIKQMVDDTVARFGQIDILINNAGISMPAPIQEMSVDAWNSVMNVNVNGIFHCSKAVFPVMMQKHYGRIVSIASFAGKRGTLYGDNTSYCASKAAVMGFTVSLAIEGARYGVAVNAVAPGAVATELTKLHPAERRKAIGDAHLLKRMAEPEEVARVVTFLASDAASFITGEVVDVNGGIYLDL